MTFDDIEKGLVAVSMGVTAFFAKLSLANDKKLTVLEKDHAALEAVVKENKKESDKVKETQLTIESVRGVIEEALERRDKAADARRADWDKLHRLEIEKAAREAAREVLEELGITRASVTPTQTPKNNSHRSGSKD